MMHTWNTQERKAAQCTYNIHWSPAVLGYVASVAEFPALQAGPKATPQAAFDVLRADVVATLERLAG